MHVKLMLCLFVDVDVLYVVVEEGKVFVWKFCKTIGLLLNCETKYIAAFIFSSIDRLLSTRWVNLLFLLFGMICYSNIPCTSTLSFSLT